MLWSVPGSGSGGLTLLSVSWNNPEQVMWLLWTAASLPVKWAWQAQPGCIVAISSCWRNWHIQTYTVLLIRIEGLFGIPYLNLESNLHWLTLLKAFRRPVVLNVFFCLRIILHHFFITGPQILWHWYLFCFVFSFLLLLVIREKEDLCCLGIG